MAEVTTLRAVAGLGATPNRLADSALVMIDCQNTYRMGVMELEGVEAALEEGERLLASARSLGVPIVHIQHDAGPGSPYDITAEIGRFADRVAPRPGEPVIVKHYPNSFVGTNLDEHLKKLGVAKLVLGGFMTHMCVNSTARGAFNLGYGVTVVARATASRALPLGASKVIPANDVHLCALAAMNDLFAVVVDSTSDITG